MRNLLIFGTVLVAPPLAGTWLVRSILRPAAACGGCGRDGGRRGPERGIHVAGRDEIAGLMRAWAR